MENATLYMNIQIQSNPDKVLASVHTENSLVQICDKTAITAQINDERLLNRGSYSLLKYSNIGDG